MQAVFTRTVVDPAWGLKVTGKEGPHGLGFFVTSDDVNQLLIPSNQRTDFASLPGTAQTTVLRYRLDVGAASQALLRPVNRSRPGKCAPRHILGAAACWLPSPGNLGADAALPRPSGRPSTEPRERPLAPDLGEDNGEIYAELGLSSADLQRLSDAGVI